MRNLKISFFEPQLESITKAFLGQQRSSFFLRSQQMQQKQITNQNENSAKS